MFPNVGPMEMLIVGIIALLVLGPKRLPDASRALGRGMREFRDSLSGVMDDHDDDDEHPPKLPSASTPE